MSDQRGPQFEPADPAACGAAPVPITSDTTLTDQAKSDLATTGAPTREPSTWGLRRGDQFFVGLLLIAAVVLLAIYAVRLSGWGEPLIEIDRLPARRYDYQLDVNRANWIEWTLLDGIGETLAKRIVADREEHGPFAKIEDVLRVHGIGPKIWEQIRPSLMIKSESPASAAP